MSIVNQLQTAFKTVSGENTHVIFFFFFNIAFFFFFCPQRFTARSRYQFIFTEGICLMWEEEGGWRNPLTCIWRAPSIASTCGTCPTTQGGGVPSQAALQCWLFASQNSQNLKQKYHSYLGRTARQTSPVQETVDAVFEGSRKDQGASGELSFQRRRGRRDPSQESGTSSPLLLGTSSSLP